MIKKYIISAKFESEACFNLGIKQKGEIDYSLQFDKFGYPYISANMFKGTLKETVEFLIKPSKSDEDKKLIDEILNIKTIETNDEINIKWSDFKLDTRIKNKLIETVKDEPEQNKKEIIIETISKIKTIAKTNENKVVESDSIKNIQVLPPKMIFNSLIEIDIKNSKNENKILELIKECIEQVDHIGIKKNRGLGKVSIALEEINEEIVKKSNSKINNNDNWILYEIQLQEPIKVSKNEISETYEPTETFLSGNVMRGSFIGNFISNIKNIETSIVDIIRNCEFYNAYPMIEYGNELKYSLPTPNIYMIDENDLKEMKYKNDISVKNKDYYFCKSGSLRAANGKEKHYSTIFDKLSKNKNLDSKFRKKSYKPGEYCFFSDKTVFGFDVNISEITRFDRQNKRTYNFETIDAGQKFYGLINLKSLNSEYTTVKEKIINQLLEIKELNIGGNRNMGCGKAIVTNVNGFENKNTLEKYIGLIKDENYKDIYTYFYSDVAIKDIDKYRKEGSYLNLEKRIYAGYNSKWQVKIPSKEIISKGSSIQSLESIKTEFDSNVIGKEEGLGYLIEQLNIFSAESIKTIKLNSIDSSYNFVSKSFDTKNICNFIEQRNKEQMIDRLIKKYVNKETKNLVEDYYRESIFNLSELFEAIKNSIFYKNEKFINEWINKNKLELENDSIFKILLFEQENQDISIATYLIDFEKIDLEKNENEFWKNINIKFGETNQNDIKINKRNQYIVWKVIAARLNQLIEELKSEA